MCGHSVAATRQAGLRPLTTKLPADSCRCWWSHKVRRWARWCWRQSGMQSRSRCSIEMRAGK